MRELYTKAKELVKEVTNNTGESSVILDADVYARMIRNLCELENLVKDAEDLAEGRRLRLECMDIDNKKMEKALNKIKEFITRNGLEELYNKYLEELKEEN